MLLFVVAMQAADCSQYLYGVYAAKQAACSALSRCQEMSFAWQGEGGVCLVQQVTLGQDDAVQDVDCDDVFLSYEAMPPWRQALPFFAKKRLRKFEH